MSAEIRPYPLSDTLIIPEEIRREHPFPIAVDYYGITPMVNVSLQSLSESDDSNEFRSLVDTLEPPISHSIKKMHDIRTQIYTDFNSSAYTLGTLYGKGMITGQMAKDQIPDVTNEELTFTSEVYKRVWNQRLPTNEGDEILHEYAKRLKNREAVGELFGEDPLIKIDPYELYELHYPQFRAKTKQQGKLLAQNETYLVSEAGKLTLNEDINISGSFTHGLLDIYCFYKTYFNTVERNSVA